MPYFLFFLPVLSNIFFSFLLSLLYFSARKMVENRQMSTRGRWVCKLRAKGGGAESERACSQSRNGRPQKSLRDPNRPQSPFQSGTACTTFLGPALCCYCCCVCVVVVCVCRQVQKSTLPTVLLILDLPIFFHVCFPFESMVTTHLYS